jgi:hypothetical protein
MTSLQKLPHSFLPLQANTCTCNSSNDLIES